MGVVTSMPYEVAEDQDSVQMLQRSSQVGEFYLMTPAPVYKDDGTAAAPKHALDVLIFDEEMDQLKHIIWEEAVYACGLSRDECEQCLPDADWSKVTTGG